MYRKVLKGELGTLDLESVFRLSQENLKTALVSELKALGYRPKSRKGFLYAPGEVPVMLIAHLDTVHRQLVQNICYTPDGTVMMSPEGIGGDDRAGVYMILRILQDANCHVLFCEDEETGGLGARRFERSGIRPEVNYLVELDRHGANDAVFYGCTNREFARFVCGFGFMENRGTFSDISVVAPHLDVAAVNISSGYYQEHRQHEYVRLDQMEENISRVREMVLTAAERFSYRGYRQYETAAGRSLWEQMTLRGMEYRTGGTGQAMMELPDNVHLLLGNHMIGNGRNYLADRSGNIYRYLPELEAAVLIDGVVAYTDNGEPVAFSGCGARNIRVMEYDEALELLRAG